MAQSNDQDCDGALSLRTVMILIQAISQAVDQDCDGVLTVMIPMITINMS